VPLWQVANRYGVSRMTIQRVLAGTSPVREET
jgi:DNA-binding LacI/PurR family transcriptional regulator